MTPLSLTQPLIIDPLSSKYVPNKNRKCQASMCKNTGPFLTVESLVGESYSPLLLGSQVEELNALLLLLLLLKASLVELRERAS